MSVGADGVLGFLFAHILQPRHIYWCALQIALFYMVEHTDVPGIQGNVCVMDFAMKYRKYDSKDLIRFVAETLLLCIVDRINLTFYVADLP